MFLAIFAIAERLRSAPHFQSWSVRDGLTVQSRQEIDGAIDVRFADGMVSNGGNSSVTVSPLVSITLIARRSDEAPALLDKAFCELIGSLQGWQVKDASGAAWSWMRLERVREIAPQDAVVGCEFLFSFGRSFDGQQCDC